MIFWRMCMHSWIRNFSSILFFMNNSWIIISVFFLRHLSHFLFTSYSWSIHEFNTWTFHVVFIKNSWKIHKHDTGVMSTNTRNLMYNSWNFAFWNFHHAPFRAVSEFCKIDKMSVNCLPDKPISSGSKKKALKCNSSPDKKIPLFLLYTNCILHNTIHTVLWCKYL